MNVSAAWKIVWNLPLVLSSATSVGSIISISWIRFSHHISNHHIIVIEYLNESIGSIPSCYSPHFIDFCRTLPSATILPVCRMSYGNSVEHQTHRKTMHIEMRATPFPYPKNIIILCDISVMNEKILDVPFESQWWFESPSKKNGTNGI